MKVCIIGAGIIGRVHLATLKNGGYDIIAVCDIDLSRANKVIEEFSLQAKAYSDYKEMLLTERPDGVHICTPHYLHAEMIIFALNNDINVLCEKPLCIKTDDIDKILLAEQSSNAILGVCHQNRYNKENLFIKDYLSSKKVISAHGQMVWHRDKAYYAQGEWRGKWLTEGGGVLTNQALHTLDLMQWLLGAPTSLSATIDNVHLKDAIEVEDVAFINMDDGRYTFFATTFAGADFPVQLTFIVNDGSIVQVTDGNVIKDGQVIFSSLTDLGFGKECYGSGHIALINDFYAHVKDGKKFFIDGKEASKVIKIILATYQSKGNKITL